MYVFPSLQAFSRLLEATIELHQAMVPEGSDHHAEQFVFRVWWVVLKIVSDVTLLWKRWLRF